MPSPTDRQERLYQHPPLRWQCLQPVVQVAEEGDPLVLEIRHLPLHQLSSRFVIEMVEALLEKRVLGVEASDLADQPIDVDGKIVVGSGHPTRGSRAD